MCKAQCLLAIFGLLLGRGFAQSWEIAMATGNQLKFYENGTNIQNEISNEVPELSEFIASDLTALAFDAVHNMLLFVDRQNDNASIFSFHITTKKFQSLVRKRTSESIHGIAFDPVKSLLFWTDTLTRTIYSMSLKQGSKNSAYGNLWLQMDDEIPRGIAVDSCRGYVYWTNVNTSKATIERARFDGSDRRVILDKDLSIPVSLAIDQRTKKLYFVDYKEGIHFTVESSNLDGSNRIVLYKGTEHRPNSLTVSKESLYWVDWDLKKVWQLPKATLTPAKPTVYLEFENEPFGIAANYLIQDQTEDVFDCEALRTMTHIAINDSFYVPPEMGLFCVHGVKVHNKEECKCMPGYVGHRCEISVCENFCFHGDCSVTDDGKPSCSCAANYEGSRCQSEKVLSKTTEARVEKTICPPPSIPVVAPTECNCTSNAKKLSMYSSEHSTDEFVLPTSCNDGWDAIRDPIIMVLGITCGLLVLTCVVLFTKILQLKKRPRIKKRIIVNKNVTPMTARPDQCEITIENCCNMNICETPCFEPRSTIRPTLLDSKPGKEEKKNLITNMEYPDDF